MSKEHNSIHEFDFNLICEYFANLDRQGPGSPEVTLKALSFIDKLTESSRIADIGCGTGGQTMVLAQHTNANITGMDLFPDFIETLNSNAGKLNLKHRVSGVVGSMENMPFKKKSLDVIWSEGAIYNIGFERGLKEWRSYLKTGGHLVVSDASWLTEKRPAEIERFWMENYPEINTISVKVSQMEQTGYIPLATFIIPENCWTENFYVPQIKVQESFLKKHAGNKNAEAFIANERHEATLYEKYKKYYGYVFYIGKKY